MQQAAATAIIVNDIGLLKAEQIPPFRTFLMANGVLARDAGAGQFCHVLLPDTTRWLPIERGRGGAPVTPANLRHLVDAFLEKQAEASKAGPVTLVAVEAVAPAKEKPGCTRQCTAPGPARSPAEQQYLDDLRDDFAMHAPIDLHSDHPDDLRINAIRRWQYADMMMATRTTQAGD